MSDMRLVSEEGNERTYRDDETGHIVKMFTTPEGFELSRPILLPDARSFSDVLEYLGEWDQFKDYESPSRFAGNPPAPRYVPETTPEADAWERKAWTRHSDGRNRVGPFATVDLSQIGGKSHRSIAVRATDAAIEAVAPRIVTADDDLTFKLVAHGDRNRVLVILEHDYIIGSHWLAYIDPATIPAYPYELRDEKKNALYRDLDEAGAKPMVRGLPGGEIEIVTRDGSNRKATIHADGTYELTWPDGSETRSEPMP